MDKIKIIAFFGEAGAGKDSIMEEVARQHPDFHVIISCTSRPIRDNEIEGINYYYYTKDDFLNKINNGDMFEYTKFNNWYYGTSKNSLDPNKINIGVFNPEGVRSLLAHPMIDAKIFRVCAHPRTRLIR